jgi:hypothetical protein
MRTVPAARRTGRPSSVICWSDSCVVFGRHNRLKLQLIPALSTLLHCTIRVLKAPRVRHGTFISFVNPDPLFSRRST